MKLKSNVIIAKRDDGFFLTFAKWSDYPMLKKIANSLSKESQKYYHPWMFKYNSSFKVKLGQTLVRLSQIQIPGKIIKTIFPYGYAIIIKCMSPEGKIVGITATYNFVRLNKGGFMATHADMICDECQGQGLGSFQRTHNDIIAKKENVTKIWSTVPISNKRSLEIQLKHGWKILETIKNVQFDDEVCDVIKIMKEL